MKPDIICVACWDEFPFRPQNQNQKYCSKTGCQQERKNRWQQNKRKNDPDYRANDAAARKRQKEKSPGYSRAYREKHPEYVERNRQQQKERNKRRMSKAKGFERKPKLEESSAADWQVLELGGKTYLVLEVKSDKKSCGRRFRNQDQYAVPKDRSDDLKRRLNIKKNKATRAGPGVDVKKRVIANEDA